MRAYLQPSLLAVLVLYSVLHFFQSAMGGVSKPLAERCGGDFEAAFPPPFAEDSNPTLAREFETWGFPTSGASTPLLAHRSAVNWRREDGPRRWNYGPIMHALTSPLALLPNRSSVCSTWLAMNLVFVGLAAVLIVRALFPDGATPTVIGIVAVMWMNFYPLLEALSQGVIDVFQLFLIAALLYCLLRRRRKPAFAFGFVGAGLAGIAAGTAVMVKFLPAVFVALFLVKRRWIELAAACGVVIVIAALAEATLGWKYSLTMNQLAPMSGYRPSQLSQTLSATVMRSFAVYPQGIREPVAVVPEARMAVAVAVVRVCLAILAVAVCALFWARRRVTGMLATEVALLCALMIYVPQWNHHYYQVALLLPLTLLLKWATSGVTAMYWWAAAIYVGSGSFLLPLSAVGRPAGMTGEQVLTTFQHLSIPAVANALLIAVIAWAYWTKQEFAKDSHDAS